MPTELTHRDYMKLAIEAMERSVHEPRSDGKASPKVGAVIVKPDYSFVTAHRGELRFGDHAEYTLLERKHRDVLLDGSTLYATLEPCAPGARSERKLGCAERIALARIKTVYVGIEDPDPKVARKGIEFLLHQGIEVHMFDRDLQIQITEANSEFLEQAFQRASEEPLKPVEPPKLSPLELPVVGQTLADLDQSLISSYRKSLGAQVLNDEEFGKRLSDQGVVLRVDGVTLASGFGLILFGDHPTDRFPQASIQLSFTSANGEEQHDSLEGPILRTADVAVDWVLQRMSSTIIRSRGATRQDPDQLYKSLIREGLINAVVHRDYDIQQARVQVDATVDRVVIKSPGGPVHPVTLQQIQDFTAPTLSRNPLIHRVFSRMGLTEEQNFGLKTMAQSEGRGIPNPLFEYQPPYLVLTIFRTAATAIDSAHVQALPPDEREILVALAARGSFSASQYEALAKVPSRTAQNRLKKYVESGILERSGVSRATRYKVKIR